MKLMRIHNQILSGIRISGRGTHVCENMLYLYIYILYIYTHVDLHRKMLDSDRVFYALDFRKRLVDNTRHELMKSHQAGDPSKDSKDSKHINSLLDGFSAV